MQRDVFCYHPLAHKHNGASFPRRLPLFRRDNIQVEALPPASLLLSEISVLGQND